MLVDADGKATLINLGLHTAVQKIFPRVPHIECNWYKSRQENEIDEVINPTKQHSLAASISVIFEGVAPYHHVGNASFVHTVVKGHLGLKKPLSMPEDLWFAVKACWIGDVPSSRTIDLILNAPRPTPH
ncbi:hypothetical protein BDQ12DRAFT_682444 [Crucibulum laeve]|uniref:Uncharacterized protein n=1 Tax=Crucibulum laeve TaxID=68775 RepID=A0A5C3MDN1_9AGAR|nr:hypothetical protein BDQ12DRAFT_682444 [Crucibulum laeve]